MTDKKEIETAPEIDDQHQAGRGPGGQRLQTAKYKGEGLSVLLENPTMPEKVMIDILSKHNERMTALEKRVRKDGGLIVGLFLMIVLLWLICGGLIYYVATTKD